MVENSEGFLVPIDEHGKPVTRTKATHPYSYDGFVTWRGGDNAEATSGAYSDRLMQFDRPKLIALSKKHFGDESDYWYSREPQAIEAFLRDWFENPLLKLILVMECCNQATGYPLWRFDFCNRKEGDL